MTSTMLYMKISNLPPSLIKEVDEFVDLLKTRQLRTEIVLERKFGSAKGLIAMHDDFDEPLEDFSDVQIRWTPPCFLSNI